MSAGNRREFIDFQQNKEKGGLAMKCPLFIATYGVQSTAMKSSGAECLKEECAWWDVPVKRCLWQNISEKLSFIYLELNDIATKMPHVEQFKK